MIKILLQKVIEFLFQYNEVFLRCLGSNLNRENIILLIKHLHSIHLLPKGSLFESNLLYTVLKRELTLEVYLYSVIAILAGLIFFLGIINLNLLNFLCNIYTSSNMDIVFGDLYSLLFSVSQCSVLKTVIRPMMVYFYEQ